MKTFLVMECIDNDTELEAGANDRSNGHTSITMELISSCKVCIMRNVPILMVTLYKNS